MTIISQKIFPLSEHSSTGHILLMKIEQSLSPIKWQECTNTAYQDFQWSYLSKNENWVEISFNPNIASVFKDPFSFILKKKNENT